MDMISEKLSKPNKPVGVFVDVSLLSSHQIRWIFQIVQQELIECTAFFVENLHSVAVTVINCARMHHGAERVSGFGIASPFVVYLS